MNFNDICDSEFLDVNVYWNTTDPDVPECFQFTVFPIFLFCYVMLFCLPYLIYLQRKGTYHNGRHSLLCILKIVLCIILLLINAAELLGLIWQQRDGVPAVPPVYLFVPGVQGFLMAAVIGVVHYEHIKNAKNSGIYFCFWFFFTIIIVLRFRTAILSYSDQMSPSDMLRFVSACLHLPLVVAQLVLACIAARQEYRTPSEERPCPENFVSFLSRLYFCWFNGLIIRGYRHPLTMDDLWSLNESDKSRNLVTPFQRRLCRLMPDFCKRRVSTSKTRKNGVTEEMNMEHLNARGSIGGDCKSDAAAPNQQLLVEVRQPRAEEKNFKTRHCVLIALLQTFWSMLLAGFVFKLCNDLLSFVNPQLLKLLISFIEEKDQPTWRGYLIAVAMLITAFIQTTVLQQYFHTMTTVGMRLRSTLTSVIYRKSMKLSNGARKTATMGEIVNIMSVDCMKLQELMTYVNTLWSSPLQIFLAITFLYKELGPSVFAGVLVMVAIIPLNAFFAIIQKKLQVKLMKHKDKRIKMMNEILSGIKVLKLYAWEMMFGRKVLDIRENELRVMRNGAAINAVSSFTWGLSPFFVCITSFAVFVLSSPDNVLTAEKAFVSLTLFNMLRFPLVMFPNVVSQMVQASVSFRRITDFLLKDEIDPRNVSQEETPGVAAVIENGSFSWEDHDGDLPLKNLSVHFPEGQLIAVVGPVGCGKSSLLSALLGEMRKVKGRVNLRGSVAYVSQLAWIRNATLRDNILFGRCYRQDLYDKVIVSCALKPDLGILPEGDMTEIGEKGINLSGGQKQRISLARACFAEADVYLLDDPMSAVDAHVGRHIFEQVIGPLGLLRDRTRILVTHSITVLPHCDTIVVLGEEGRMSEMGSYKQLMQRAGPFASFIASHLNSSEDKLKLQSQQSPTLQLTTSEEELHEKSEILDDLEAAIDATEAEEKETGRAASAKNAPNSMRRLLMASRESLNRSRLSLTETKNSLVKDEGKKCPLNNSKNVDPSKKLIKDEKVEEGKVKFSVFITYFKAIGVPLSIMLLLSYFAFYFFQLGSQYWLADWAEDTNRGNITVNNITRNYSDYYRNYRLGVYGSFGIGQAIMQLLQSLLWAWTLMRTARGLHHGMLINILRSPMTFFDTTPTGRILNRFSKDIDVVDSMLVMLFNMLLMCIFSVVTAMVAVMLPNKYLAVPLVPILVIYVVIQRVYVSSARQLKRLESISRSPVISHFGESLQGVSTIRAFGHVERFIEHSEHLVDTNVRCHYPIVTSNRWLAVRLETIGNLIVFFTALFAVISRDTESRTLAGLAGMAISYALGMTQTLNWMVRMTSDVEANVVSVERIKEHSELPTEAALVVEAEKPSSDWPKGELTFEEYSCRYREDLDPVLREISCDIRAGEKIGVVGRTGAGKSSLVLALFRIVEPMNGRIIIDGRDISRLGLHELRSHLTIIPQDPVLFSGSMRLNLDPEDGYDDERLWTALDQAHLSQFVRDNAAGLDMNITEGGENLSVGQRQLVCLARAVLRRTKILVLDEATSAVDLDTDKLIQNTIREQFKDATILTIAHRLHTIIDYDRILVLDRGNIDEFASPQELMADPDSSFYKMAEDADLLPRRE